jgi:hypothetical protein
VRAELPDSLFSAYGESVGVSVPEPAAPAPIQDLVVAGAEITAIQLAWTATGNDQRLGRATRYDLRRSNAQITTEDAFAAAIPIGGVPAPQDSDRQERFTVTGLLPATDYYFAVKAGDDVPLWSPLSNSPRGTTLPLPPSAPQELVAEAISESAIRLHWTDRATNETRYRIEHRSQSDPEFILVFNMAGSFTGTVEYQDDSLTERTSYNYRVRAENTGGVSAWLAGVAQRTGIARPTNLTAVAMTPDSVALAWSFPYPHPTDGFRLERRTVSAGFVAVASPAPANRAFGDGGVRPLTTYVYRLRAADTGDISDPSDSVQVTTPDLSPVCRLDPAALDFDTVSVGSSLDRTIRITNAGGGRLTGSVATTCPAFRILTGGGGFSLGEGESRPVTVQFSPASPGPAQCTLTPADACGPLVCSGTGEAIPVCNVDPPTLAFGNVPVNSSADRTFTISNTGGGILSGSIALSCAAYSIASGGGSFALHTGQTQRVTIRFSPKSPGEAPCTVTSTGGCASVTCSGTGEGLPLCSVNPTSLDFKTVTLGTFADSTITITNIGGGTLSGTVATSTACSYYSVRAGGGPFSLGAGLKHVVTIRFRPLVAGSAVCNVTLGTSSDCSSISCIGVGERAAACLVTPATLAFGAQPVGSSVDSTFTITNNGSGTLSGNVATACAGFSVLSGGGPFALGAGQTKPVTIRFAPTLPGVVGCTITPTAGCSVTCSGTGLGPACVLDPPALAFGAVLVGTSVDSTFTITNTGGGTLSGSVTGTCAVFIVVSGSGRFDLTTGQTQEVTVRFFPTLPGPAQCTLTFTGGCSPIVCTGTGDPLPSCSVYPDSLDFGTVLVDTLSDRSFVLTNTGGGTLSGTVSAACNDYSIVQGSGPYALGHDQTDTVTVRFRPPSDGVFPCTVTLGNPGDPGCTDISCTGIGQGPVCSVSPTSLDFGSLQPGETARRTFTVTNTGGGRLEGGIIQVHETTCPPFLVETGYGAYSLAHGEVHTVTVLYDTPAPGVDSCRVDGCQDGVLCVASGWWAGFSPGNAPDGMVTALAVHGSQLAVGGYFTDVGGESTENVAWWNGSTWTPSTAPLTLTSVDVLQEWQG